MASKAVELGVSAVEKSKFEFIRKGNKVFLEIDDAYIFWPNFSGKPNLYNNTTRNFNVGITEAVAAILSDNGWKVRSKDIDETGEKFYFVNIKLKMEGDRENFIPPIITVFSKKADGQKVRRAIDVATVGELDIMRFERVSVLINPYESATYKGKVSGYLSKLSGIAETSLNFGGHYDDWLTADEEVSE